MSLPLEYATCGRDGLGGPKPGWEAAAWLANQSTLLTLFFIFALLPLIFPNRRFLSDRWRSFLQVCLGVLAAFLLLSSIWPGALFILEAVDAGQYPNLLAISTFTPPAALDRLLRQTPNLFIVIAGVIASFSLVLRLIRCHLIDNHRRRGGADLSGHPEHVALPGWPAHRLGRLPGSDWAGAGSVMKWMPRSCQIA